MVGVLLGSILRVPRCLLSGIRKSQFALASVIVNNFFDSFENVVCDVCGAELFPFQVSSHADLHFMRFDESELSNVE